LGKVIFAAFEPLTIARNAIEGLRSDRVDVVLLLESGKEVLREAVLTKESFRTSAETEAVSESRAIGPRAPDLHLHTIIQVQTISTALTR
jgi:hypothetical protein